MVELRDYQSETITKLRHALATGSRRPVVQAPTGAGKTVIAAAIVKMAREKGKRIIFCVPALSLINQTVERFQQNGIHDIGVIQGLHEMTDYRQPVQVASVQTLMRREFAKADLVIIDEAHVMFKFYHEWFADPEWQDVPIIGLTATPWQRGMGKLWDRLIIATTTQELINMKHLSDFKVFAPTHPDLTGVRTKAGDYHEGDLANVMDKNTLIADIVSTWLEKGQRRPTLCFAVNRAHAKNIQTQFEDAGVRTAYLDAFTSLEERDAIARDFANGDTEVVCNVGVLTTGVDWDVRCIILARPTKSEILYTQIIGRGLRTARDKDCCIILDHSDTTLRLGFVTDIHYDELDDGRPKVKKEPREKKEKLPKECPKCAFLRPAKTRTCPACGFIAEAVDQVDQMDGELAELRRDGSRRKSEYSIQEKQQFYSELIGYAQEQGYKQGWAYWTYKDKFGVGPANNLHSRPEAPSPSTLSWIRHRNIVKAKWRAKQERRA